MDDEQIRQAVFDAKEALVAKCLPTDTTFLDRGEGTYAGALTIEYVRRGLAEHGIPTSDRSVFIDGVPFEVDLIVPRNTTPPEHGILYQAENVVAALEVRHAGVFVRGGTDHIRAYFERIQVRCPGIWCAYVTLTEGQGYKWKVTSDNLRFPAYTLFWRGTLSGKPQYTSTGDWVRFVNDLKERLSGVPSPQTAGVP
jgi:hypothetical protein